MSLGTVARSWVTIARPAGIPVVTEPKQRRVLQIEMAIVLGITIGLSAVRSALSLLDSLLDDRPLDEQTVALNSTVRDNEFVDLLYQLTRIGQYFGFGALGLYMLWRSGIGPRLLGLNRDSPRRDLTWGAGLAALIGIPGLGLYLVAHAVGASLTIVPSDLTETWYRLPVLCLSSMGNAWAEETLIVAYLITRLRQLGWTENRSLVAAAALRGSYHLYQGFGGFVSSFLMGLVYGRVWQRTNRLWPLIIGHALIDVVAFCGYALLHDNLGWIPDQSG